MNNYIRKAIISNYLMVVYSIVVAHVSSVVMAILRIAFLKLGKYTHPKAGADTPPFFQLTKGCNYSAPLKI